MGHIYHHSGHLGDMIYAMPAMRVVASVEGPIDLEISPVQHFPGLPPLNAGNVGAIKPLLLSQRYVRSVTFVEKMTPGARDLDVSRHALASPAERNLAAVHLRKLRDYKVSWLAEPWLVVDPIKIATVILNRSPRWHEPGSESTWKRIIQRCPFDTMMIGVPDDFAAFESEVGKIQCYKPPDLLAAAQVIAGAEFFIGNQSACLAIAQGLRHPGIAFERCRGVDNCDIPQIPTVKFDEGRPFEDFLERLAHHNAVA